METWAFFFLSLYFVVTTTREVFTLFYEKINYYLGGTTMKTNKVKNFFDEHKGAIVKGAAAVGTLVVVTFLVSMGLRKKTANIYKLEGVIEYD